MICSELKKQINGAKRSIQHMMSSGCNSAAEIEAKQKLLDSYESFLRRHCHQAAKK